MRVEVVVAGAGTAGAAAALSLAPFRNVLLADAVAEPGRRVGESLLPAARMLMADMGVLDRFQQIGSLPYYANRSIWGSPSELETDFLSDPAGHGWHIDRARFERMLRSAAVDRGAILLAPARLESIRRDLDRFVVEFRSESGLICAESDFVIDATGGSSAIAIRLGAKRRCDLPLVSSAVYGKMARVAGAGITFVEAVENGWWYTAPVPGGERIVAFHADSDLDAANYARTASGLMDLAGNTTGLRRVLEESEFAPECHVAGRFAGGSFADACCGDGWLAAGDAALTFDPLASRGLFSALYLGLAGASVADSYLAGDRSAMDDYRATVLHIRNAYRRGLAETYAQERRWPDAPFWKRRLLPSIQARQTSR